VGGTRYTIDDYKFYERESWSGVKNIQERKENTTTCRQSLQNQLHPLSLNLFNGELFAIARDMYRFRHLSLQACAEAAAESRHNALVLFFAPPFVVQRACAAVHVLRGVPLVSKRDVVRLVSER